MVGIFSSHRVSIHLENIDYDLYGEAFLFCCILMIDLTLILLAKQNVNILPDKLL